MSDVTLELADRLWRGEVPAGEYHPVGHRRGLAEICDGVANACVVRQRICGRGESITSTSLTHPAFSLSLSSPEIRPLTDIGPDPTIII
jgi:hypothetical protein